ncbi:hypothetical protein LTR08_002029 [Meristemomyces frigidus]|nr:hypothetical protein LTR08_002029 [Meristemomyces frigidus]
MASTRVAVATHTPHSFDIPQFILNNPRASEKDTLAKRARELCSLVSAEFVQLDQESYAKQYTAPANDPTVFDNENNMHPGAEGDEPAEDDDADDEQWTTILKEGAEGVANALRNPVRVPTYAALEAQRVSQVIRRYWREANDDEITSEVATANGKITDKNKSEGESEASYNISAQAITFSMRNIMGFLISFVDSKEDAANARSIVNECLALVRILDSSGLSWKSITIPEVSGMIEKVFGKRLEAEDPDPEGLLEAFIARQAEACQYQTDLVTESREPLSSFYKAVAAGNESEAGTALDTLIGVNKALQDANDAAGFNSDDHLIPVVKMQSLIDYCSQVPNVRTTILEQNQMLLITFFDRAGYKDMHNFMLDLYNGPPNSKVNAFTMEWIDAEVRKYKQPLAIGPGEHPEGPSSRTSAASRTATTAIASSVNQPNIAVAPKISKPTNIIIPGPSFANGMTDFGKIVEVRNLGGAFRGYRTIVNVGSDECEVYECMPASDFGRNMGKTLYDQYQQSANGVPTASRLKHADRQARDIQGFTAIAIAKKSEKSNKAPITYFRVVWRSIDGGETSIEWITKSDAISLCGKKRVSDAVLGYTARLLRVRGERLAWLDKCKAEEVDPDTGDSISKGRRTELRWLFPHEKTQDADQILSPQAGRTETSVREASTRPRRTLQSREKGKQNDRSVTSEEDMDDDMMEL